MQKDGYYFYPIDKFDVNGNQMFYYFNSKLLVRKDETFLEHISTRDVERNYSLWEYMNYTDREYVCNFWWNLESDYFVFFGEEKKDLSNYFINSCYERDGKVEGIQKRLRKAGYKV